jgi:hypothetical protein
MKKSKVDTTTQPSKSSSNKTAQVKRTRAYYTHALADRAKERRHQEGEVRNAAWRSLTPEEQLRTLAKRPGESRRQVVRIAGYDMSAAEAVALFDEKGWDTL